MHVKVKFGNKYILVTGLRKISNSYQDKRHKEIKHHDHRD
jgi:hypothetical protein